MEAGVSTLYIYQEDNKPLGFISIEEFKTDKYDTYLVADFMVLLYKQRTGIGRRLFDFMLQDNNLHPPEIIYDAPSYATDCFLKRYYNLETYLYRR